ncbi:hypothetical protein AVEN_95053-1 [Araneus ventricosus]|uniref:Uncharacterized protein n=1 Tax=Araneus ventricosus TaxID=182803 RepID=A0A4Y2QK31_ARAVE|nr:hypothetical protein AVEN_189843-1 [Araneus ventricosus]GBN63686.1 hypothetical protein AVEN_95053-1 [Araneus ventricosus]
MNDALKTFCGATNVIASLQRTICLCVKGRTKLHPHSRPYQVGYYIRHPHRYQHAEETQSRLDTFQVSTVIMIPAESVVRPGEEREEIPLFSASAEHSKLCSVLAKEKTIIPARSECLIQRAPEVSGKFRYTVTDLPSQISQKDVLVAATLVDLKREAIPVQVLNLDNKHKTVDKGAVIATSEPVVDIVARPQEFSESLRLPSIL